MKQHDAIQDDDDNPQWSVSQTALVLMLIGAVLSILLVLIITASPGH
jgi:hypothetical protein